MSILDKMGMKKKILYWKNFFLYEIWLIEHERFARLKSFFYRILQVIVLAVNNFLRDKIQLRASALTFYLILSIVPILAMAFGIAEGFGISKLLESELRQTFQGQEQVLEFMLKFAHSMLDTTKGGAIAGVGLLILFWSVMKLLNHIEDAFNKIWKVRKARTFLRKLTDYFSILLFAPVLMILASSTTIFITTQIESIIAAHKILNFLSGFMIWAFQFIPYFFLWLLFTLIYIILPNTKVKFVPALIAGVIAGTAFQLTQWAYINFQIGVSRYSAIYGSFAALPLFLIWAQLSWEIILIGSELGFSIQNVSRYRHISLSEDLSFSLKFKVALVLLQKIIFPFLKGESPPDRDILSDKTRLPYTIINQVCNLLLDTNLIHLVSYGNDLEGFVPALNPDDINFAFVYERLSTLGLNTLPTLDLDQYKVLQEVVTTVELSRQKAETNFLIKDLIINSF